MYKYLYSETTILSAVHGPCGCCGQPQALRPSHISIRHYELCRTHASMNTSAVEIPYESGTLVDFRENTVKMVKYNECIEQILQKINDQRIYFISRNWQYDYVRRFAHAAPV